MVTNNEIKISGSEAVVQPTEMVPVETQALEVMERAQIDVQISTAHRYPRSLAQFIKRAGDMVSIDRETAASCMYSRPVGKKPNGQVEYCQGESIRLAEIVAATYGNIRVGAIISEMTPRYVKAVGMAHDLESNYGFKAEVVESTVTKYGKPFSERMRVVVAKAAQSKAIRDAIFRVVPKSLCRPIATIAMNVALGEGMTLIQRRENLVEWLTGVGADFDNVYSALGVDGIEDIGQEQLIILTGIKTAIKDGDITIQDAFPTPVGVAAEKAVTGAAGLKKKLKAKKKAKAPQPDPPKDQPAQHNEELRYYCKECDAEFAEKTGAKKELCPKCLGKDVLDRQATKGVEVADEPEVSAGQ